MNKLEELIYLQELEKRVREQDLRRARNEFFFYCHLKAPDFYKYDRPFLINLCNDLQEFVGGDDEVLILNLPPR